MSEMIERVARVIREGYADRKGEFAIARAVIAAMREPTEAMVEAGYQRRHFISSTYEAMIDAALEEEIRRAMQKETHIDE